MNPAHVPSACGARPAALRRKEREETPGIAQAENALLRAALRRGTVLGRRNPPPLPY